MKKLPNDIVTLLKQVDEFNPSETKLWQAKSTLLKVYSIWLRDVFQHQWIVPPNEKKEVYQNLLTQLTAQSDIKILRSPNLLMQGLIQYALKNFKNAEVLYREALLEDSKNAYLLQCLAKVYTQQGKYSEAASYLTQALELDPSNEESLGELSYVYLQTSRQEEALSLINKALEIDPNYVRNLIVLAIILADKGQNRRITAAFIQK
ncbi:MAG: tetratricopeptide repeat protein [Saprospiraceae bacterium]|nr:tetratricopeptide repeat protein [Saprospiraceae bacterium]